MCLNMPGVSGGDAPPDGVRNEPNLRVERFCDKFAAAFLIPISEAEVDAELRHIASRDIVDDAELRYFARRLKISKYALLRRMLEGDYIEELTYWAAYNEWAEADRKAPKKRSSGGAHYADVQFSEKGKRYVSLVMEALDSGVISYHDASSYLSIDAKWFDRARSYSQWGSMDE